MKRILATWATLAVLLTITVLHGEDRRKRATSADAELIPPPLNLPTELPAAEPPKGDKAVPSVAPKPAPVDPAIVNEIARLRAQIGSPFKGTVLDSGNKPAAFAKSLQRLMQDLPQPQTRKPGLGPAKSEKFHPPLSESTAIRSALVAAQRRNAELREQLTVADKSKAAVPATTTADAALVTALRRSARLLDERANDLEDRDACEEADRIRALATELRCEARAVRGVKTAGRPSLQPKVQRKE